MHDAAPFPDLEGRVALVTGGASGIGRACVQRLLASGAKVASVDLHTRPSDHASLLVIAADVTQPNDMLEAVASCQDHFGGLDLAVNSAGVGAAPRQIEDTDPADWDRVIGVNLTGVFNSLRAEIPAMRRRGAGSIVNVSSVFGHRSRAGASAYVASKHAVEGLGKAAAVENRAHHIRVNTVAPGFVDTELVRAARTEAEREEISRCQADGRLARPEEIADTIAYLLSPQASFVSGASLVVDGAMLVGIHD